MYSQWRKNHRLEDDAFFVSTICRFTKERGNRINSIRALVMKGDSSYRENPQRLQVSGTHGPSRIVTNASLIIAIKDPSAIVHYEKVE